MKNAFITISIICAVGAFSCTKSPDPITSAPTDLTYNVYDRYYYIGPRPQSDSTMFYWTTSKTQFDTLYGIFIVKHTTDTIPRTDFAVKNIVSFVKYGYTEYALHVDTVTLANQTLFVRYTSSPLVQDMTSTIAQSVIITTYAGFTTVEFMENGVKAGELVRTLIN